MAALHNSKAARTSLLVGAGSFSPSRVKALGGANVYLALAEWFIKF
jgi:hypothetical protein